MIYRTRSNYSRRINLNYSGYIKINENGLSFEQLISLLIYSDLKNALNNDGNNILGISIMFRILQVIEVIREWYFFLKTIVLWQMVAFSLYIYIKMRFLCSLVLS